VTRASPARPQSAWAPVDIPTVIDGRGSLGFAEGNGAVPFSIERVYWIYGIPSDMTRGRHSHLTVEELLIAVAGEFSVHCDNGIDRGTVHLDDPSSGLLIGSGVWRELDAFSRGAVCLVLASGPYDEDEYIRDYSAFAASTKTANFAVQASRLPRS
jgi:hypothetical protein